MELDRLREQELRWNQQVRTYEVERCGPDTIRTPNEQLSGFSLMPLLKHAGYGAKVGVCTSRPHCLGLRSLACVRHVECVAMELQLLAFRDM